MASARLLAVAVVVGALGGLLAVAFRLSATHLQAWITGRDGSILDAARALPWWHALLLPAAGALVGGALVHFGARSETAFGLTDLMEVVSFRRRQIRFAPTIARIGSALATIASGGSLGREGPIIQLGATAANLVGRATRFDPRRHSILLGCGVAAGMSAAYNAPIAGAVFVMEAVLANFAMDVFAAVALASVAGVLVMRACLGDAVSYEITPRHAGDALTTVIVALPLGVICGGGAIVFQRLLQRAKTFFSAARLHPIAKPALGGLLVGAIGLQWPEVWGNGYEAIGKLLHFELPLFDGSRWLAPSIVALLFFKPIATACSVGSGGQGGVFTPALFLGACTGALFCAVVHRLPGVNVARDTLALVGMGGLIAGITHAPIMAVALLFEMTRHVDLLLPLVICASASALTAKLLARDSLYTESLRARGVPVDAGIEELALRQTRVGDLMQRDAPIIAPRTTLHEIIEKFTRERLDLLYVVDEGRKVLGVVLLHDVKDFINKSDGAHGKALLALDVLRRVPVLDPASSIADVLEVFDEPDLDELPVARPDPDGALLGRVTRRDLLATLHLEVLGRPSLRAKFVIEGDENPRYLELPRGYEMARIPVTKALAGKRLGDTGLRRNHRLVVLAIVRPDPEIGEQRIAFDPDLRLEEGEQLVVMGNHAEIERVRARSD